MVRATWGGFSGYANNMAYWIDEYNKRRTLTKLGFIQSIDELDSLEAEIFGEISAEISRIEAEEAKAKRK